MQKGFWGLLWQLGTLISSTKRASMGLSIKDKHKIKKKQLLKGISGTSSCKIQSQ